MSASQEVSQLAPLSYSGTMVLYAVDPALPAGQRSGKISAGALAASMLGGAPLPLAFMLPGFMPPRALYSLAIAVPVTIPANLGGSVAYWGTPPSADAVFTLTKISSGLSTPIGTVTLPAGFYTGPTLSVQGAVNLAAGDVLQLATPATPDTTLQDLGLTILAARG